MASFYQVKNINKNEIELIEMKIKNIWKKLYGNQREIKNEEELGKMYVIEILYN